MKNIFIYLLRGISYIAFPIGILLFGLFILAASSNDLDFSLRSLLQDAVAILCFFLPPIIILSLHSFPKQQGPNSGLVMNRVWVNFKYDRQFLPIVIMLAALGLGLLFFFVLLLSFMGLVTGG